MQASISSKSDSLTAVRDDHDKPDLNRRNNGKKLRRAKLSCLECRRKKLSCDRNLPCQRCIRSRRAESCTFEDGPQVEVDGKAKQQAAFGEQLLKLQSDVTQLQKALAETQTLLRYNDEVTPKSVVTTATTRSSNEQTTSHQHYAILAQPENFQVGTLDHENQIENITSNDPYFRSPRIFYSRHFLFRFFSEMPGMWSLISETMDEWIRPLGIHLKKDKTAQVAGNGYAGQQETAATEDLLPFQEDMDQLIAFYMNHLEHVYRVVHTGTLQRQYASYWQQNSSRDTPVTMLLIAISSLATSTYGAPCHPNSLTMRYRHMHKQWLNLCDEWLAHAGRKRRGLIHHQVATIVYLSKRANGVEKKSWWKLTASLVQDAVMDGLHCGTSLPGSPLVEETKRRVWATIRELDLQNSFELGLPSLLFSLDCETPTPANVNDADFDEESKELPSSQSPDMYTDASYLCHSARTWKLRLDIAHRLCSSQPSKLLNYTEVLHYTSLLMQAVEDLPQWTHQDAVEHDDNKALAHTFLLGPLQQAILSLHQISIHGGCRQMNLSRTICYDTAREMLLSKQKLKCTVFPAANLLRADVFLAALIMSNIVLLRNECSDSRQANAFAESIELLEECLPLMEENLARRAMGGHWDLNTVYAADMLVKISLGLESHETAKASMAKRFLGAYHKFFGKHSSPNVDDLQPRPASNSISTQQDGESSTTSQNELIAQGWSWLSDEFAEIDFDAFDSSLGLDSSLNEWTQM